MSKNRAQHLAEYEQWAERVQPHELRIRGRSQEVVDLLDEGPEAGAEVDPPALPAGV